MRTMTLLEIADALERDPIGGNQKAADAIRKHARRMALLEAVAGAVGAAKANVRDGALVMSAFARHDELVANVAPGKARSTNG